MQAVHSEADLHLDALRQPVRKIIAAASLETEHVFTGLALRGIHDFERHTLHRHDAEFFERQRVAGLVLRGVKPAPRVGVEHAAEVEQTEISGVGHEIRDDVADAFRRERLEALGHQRKSRVAACGDVRFFDLRVAARVAHEHRVCVFADDDAVERIAVFLLHVDGKKTRIDLAVRVEDRDCQTCLTVQTHPSEIGREFLFAAAFVGVADETVLLEDRLAAGGVSGLHHDRHELRDEIVLQLQLRAAQFVDCSDCGGGNFAVGVRAQASDGDGAEFGEADLFQPDRLDKRERPVGAPDDLIQQGLAHHGVTDFRKLRDERRADARVAGVAERVDDARLHFGRCLRADHFRDGGQNIRAECARADESDSGLRTPVGGGFGVVEFREERFNDGLRGCGERVIFVPRGDERQRGGGDAGILRGEQLRERTLQRRRPFRHRRASEGREQRLLQSVC